MKTTVELDLLDDYRDRYHKAIDRTLGDGAAMVQGDAQAIVAVDTGRLRASIELRRVGNMLYEVFTVVHYAGYVEHGTRYQVAQPFFRPAYERNYQLIIQLLARELANL